MFSTIKQRLGPNWTLNITSWKRLSLITAIILPLCAVGGYYGARAISGQPAPDAMPAGAVPIAPRYITDFDKAIEDFKKAQAEMAKAQRIVKRAMELSLSDASVSLDKFDDYRLDENKKWMVPLTEAEKAKAKKAQELQQQFNQQLQAGQ